MRKILSAALVICMLSTLLVLPVSAEEVVLDNFESATIGAVEMTPTGTADNKTITANIWAETGSNTYPEIVENKYGNLGKALMIKQPKFPKYGSNQAKYTDSVFVNFPAAVNTEGKSASFNIYVPDLPGDNYLQMYLYEYGVGTYVGTRTHTLEPGWHQIGIYCNTDKQRICLDGTSFAEGGKTGDFQVRFRMYSDLSDLTEVAAFVSEDMWYIIDDFMVADVATYSAYTTGMTAAGTSVSSADTAEVADVITGLSVGTGVTAKAVKIDGVGNTTEVTTNIKDATHIVEKSQYSAIRLFPLALTGTIGNPGEDAEVHWAVGSGIVGELQPFIKVGKLVDAINAAENTSNTVKIVTSDGKTASRDMLVNDSMKVKFVSSAYAAEYSIVPRMAKYADSTGTAAGTAIAFGSSPYYAIGNIGNVFTDGTRGINLTATAETVGDLNGYKFDYSNSGTPNSSTPYRSGFRTQASSDTGVADTIMKNGAYSVAEMVIKPGTYSWYVMEYRFLKSDATAMTVLSGIDAFTYGNVYKTPAITFAPDGKIYMGGAGNIMTYTESTVPTSGTYLADYAVNNTYKVQVVFETPASDVTSFKIAGIYINGTKCNDSTITIDHGQQFVKLGEIDCYMWPKSGETAYTVSYAGIKAYSCDNFTVDAKLPTTIDYPSTTYDNDAVVGGKTLKPNSLTTVSALVGTTAADNGYCMWVTDADDNEVAGTATIADGMTLNAASLDGKAKGTSYKISFATDYGKLTKSENTYSRTVYNENGAMKMLVAVYDGAVLKDAYMSASPAESGLEKTLTVSARALTGSETAKAFLWDSLGSLKPYIGACEIANDGAITQVNATNY